ncbi:hypothetical protein RUM44_003730 [Polyplax serrata]|uniref:Uncharacterized protein n=1 Tax=Polyplax serrata TaxID=468196 RepID=A0ABR1AHB1_POLSC
MNNQGRITGNLIRAEATYPYAKIGFSEKFNPHPGHPRDEKERAIERENNPSKISTRQMGQVTELLFFRNPRRNLKSPLTSDDL